MSVDKHRDLRLTRSPVRRRVPTSRAIEPQCQEGRARADRFRVIVPPRAASAFGCQAVAFSVERADVARLVRIELDLAAQPGDRDVDGSRCVVSVRQITLMFVGVAFHLALLLAATRWHDNAGTTIPVKVLSGMALLIWPGVIVASRWIAYA